jgi:ribosomal protein S18 acetylase RimI-like enzyme
MHNRIVSFNKAYAPDVVRLHKEGISTGFLSKMNNTFLRLLYRAIDRTPYSRVFVAIDDETHRTLGFIACSLNTGKMYRYIIGYYGIPFIFLLLPEAFKRQNQKRIFETLFYYRKTQPSATVNRDHSGSHPKAPHVSCCAELLSIAVDKYSRGRKIGKKLVDALEEYFANNGVHTYKVVTFSEDSNANAFYRACGFVKQGEFPHHGNLMFEYSKTIP